MKYLLSIAVVVLLCIRAHAQLFPVQVNTQLVPPFTPYLSDFTAPGSQKLMVQFTIIDPAFSEYSCKLRLTIEGVNITIRTKPTYVPRPITIQGGGIPQLFYGEDLAEYFNPDALDFSGLTRSQYEKGAKLPEGVYRISIEVLDLRRNTVVSNKGTGMAWIILNDPPLVNLPRNNAKVSILDPTNIAFTWTPRHTGSPNAAFTTEYKFRIVEIWPINRNPFDAFLSQPTLYETTTELSQLVYSIGEPALLPGRKYAWQVQAVDTEGRDLFKNQGKSEVFVFQYGDALSVPEGLYLQSATAASLNVRWEIPTMGSVPTGYGLQYRPHHNRKHDNWYKVSTIDSWKTIDNLEPDTQYEVRLRSEQGATYSDYSSPQVFTTSNISSGEFSCRSDIGNPIVPGGNTLAPKISIGDVIHAAGFEVIVRSLVSNGGGSYSGEGAAIVPLFNSALVHVTFTNIAVNEKLWLTSGEIVTFYNPASPFVLNVKKPDAPAPVEEVDVPAADSITVTNYNIVGIIDSVWVDTSTGEIIVENSDGKTTKLTQPSSGGEKQAVQISDSGGNSYVVDKDGVISEKESTILRSGESSYTVADEFLQNFVLFYLNENDFKYQFCSALPDAQFSEEHKAVMRKKSVHGSEQLEFEKKCELILDHGQITLYKPIFFAKNQGSTGDLISYSKYYDLTSKSWKDYRFKYEIENTEISAGDKIKANDYSNDIEVKLMVAKENDDFKLATSLWIRKKKVIKKDYKIYCENKQLLDDPTLLNSFEVGSKVVLEVREVNDKGEVLLVAEDENVIAWESFKDNKKSTFTITSIEKGKKQIEVSVNGNIASVVLLGTELFTSGLHFVSNDFITEAKKQIEKKSPFLLSDLKTIQVNIDVLKSTDDVFNTVNSGDHHFGVSTLPFRHNGLLRLIPSLIVREDGCIKEIPIVLKVKYDFVKYLKEDALVNCALNNDNYRLIFERLKTTYPDLGRKIESWIKDEQIDKAAEIQRLSDNDNLNYVLTDAELDQEVSVTNVGTISLNADNLNDIKKYAKGMAPSNSTKTGEMVLDDLLKRSEENAIKKLIQQQYTRTLAHELMHVYYKKNNKVVGFRWSFLGTIGDCRSFIDGSSCKYCSSGPGHEKNNPDGQQVCQEQCKYPNPIYHE